MWNYEGETSISADRSENTNISRLQV